MLASWEIMPKRLMMQLGGMGIYNTPMREVWMDSPPLPTSTSLEFSSYLEWMKQLFMRNWVLWSSGAASLVYLLYHRVRLGWLLMGIISINCIAALIPQARDPAFAESNFLLGQLALICAFSICCTHLFRRHILLPCFLPILIAFTNPTHNIERGLEHTQEGLSAISWIQKNSTQQTVWVSSYENAPIIWLAKRDWKQWEDPWHPIQEPHYRITSNLDVFDMGQELCTNQKLDAFFQSKNTEPSTWIAIYSCAP